MSTITVPPRNGVCNNNPSPDHKTCKACGEAFPRTAAYFFRHPRTADRLGSRCKRCQIAWARQWRAEHPERPREARREASRRYRAKHRKPRPPVLGRRVLAWANSVRKRGGIRPDRSAKEYVRELQRGPCSYCGRTDRAVGVDHIVPVKAGGTNTVDNLTACCRSCNGRKSDLNLLTFIALLGYEHWHAHHRVPATATTPLLTMRGRAADSAFDVSQLMAEVAQ